MKWQKISRFVCENCGRETDKLFPFEQAVFQSTQDAEESQPQMVCACCRDELQAMEGEE